MQFPLIDVLRAVAALLVLVFHVSALGHWSVFDVPLWGLPFRQGWIGVDLFLVISGFVITLSAVRERERNPLGFRLRFMLRRIRRLVPLYLLTSVVYLFLVRPEILTRPAEQLLVLLASHVLFLQNLHSFTHGVINGVSWSLALEMQFYLALVFSVGYLKRPGAGRVLFLLVSVAWAWRWGVCLQLPPGEAAVQQLVVYSTELPGTLDAFGMGIALALLHGKASSHWARRLTPEWSNCLLWALLTVALLWLAAALFLPRSDYWSHTPMIVFWRTLLAMGFAAALAMVITCPWSGNGLLQPLRYLGQISYGIYLWHFPVLLSLLTLPALGGIWLLTATLTGAVLLASLSWHLMERHWIASPLQPGPVECL
jgi:peptidoglycan/LPS O-acetylase OafA/YrhL